MAKDIKFNVSVEGVDKATNQVEQLNDSLNETAKNVENVSGSAEKGGGLMKSFSGSLGGLKGALGSVDEATGGFGKTLMGLLANPIVAIVAGIAAVFMILKKALQSTEEGQNKLNKITTIASTMFGKLMDVIEPLASFIADYVIFQMELLVAVIGKVGEALASTMRFFGFGEAADGLDEYMKKAEEAAAVAAKVSDERAKADKLDRENIVARAEADRLTAEAKLMMSDKEKFSLEEREDAARKAAEAQDAVAQREIKAAQIRLDALRQEAALTGSNKETLNEIANLEANLIQLNTERAGKLEELNGVITALRDEDKASEEEKRQKAKEAAQKRVEAAKKAYDEMLNALRNNLSAELQLLDDNNKKLRLAELERFNSGLINIDEYNASIKQKEEQAVLDRIAILEKANEEINSNTKIKAADRADLIAQNERAITDLELKLAGERQKELLEQEKKAEEDRKKEVEDKKKKDLEVAAKERLDLIIKFNEGIITSQEDFNKEMAALELKQMKDQLEGLEVGSEEYLNLQGEILSKEKEMRDGANAEALAADEAAYQKRLEKLNDIMGMITQISDTALGVISEISQRSFDTEMERIDTQTNTAISELDRQKAAGLITEEKYNKELEKLNKKRAVEEDKAKRAKFNQDKAIKSIETIINTAAGIAAAIPNIPLMVIAGIAGAAQLAMIMSQQYPSAGGGGGAAAAAPTISAPPAAAPPAPFVETSLPEFTGMEAAGPGGALIGDGGREGTTTRVEVVLVESEFSAVQNRVRVLEDRSLIQ